MNKIFLSVCMLCLCAALTSCGGPKPESSELPSTGVTGGVSFAPQSDKEGFAVSAEIETPSSGEQRGSPIDAEAVENESSQTSNGTGTAAQSGPGYAQLLSSGKYRLIFEVIFPENDEEIKTLYDMAVSGDKAYVCVKNEKGDVQSITLAKGGRIYTLSGSKKTYTEQSGSIRDARAIDTKGFSLAGSGQEDGVPYEEYRTKAGGTVRLYMQNGKLVQMTFAEEGYALDMQEIEISADVPDSLFEIPKNYKKSG